MFNWREVLDKLTDRDREFWKSRSTIELKKDIFDNFVAIQTVALAELCRRAVEEHKKENKTKEGE